MQRHFDDLRTIERHLVAGRLAEAKSLAFLFTKPETDPSMNAWFAESARVVAAATALTQAKTVDEACRLEPRIAQACAECHQRTQHLPLFPRAPRLPLDDSTASGRMTRHQWAVDRMWEGMVGAAPERWRAGLEVLSTTPFPFSPQAVAPGLARLLQKRARDALADQPAEAPEHRTQAYGEMLVTCVGCHTTKPMLVTH